MPNSLLTIARAGRSGAWRWRHLRPNTARFSPRLTQHFGRHVQMIVEPDLRIPDFAKAGADIISVHAEQSSTIHLHRSLNMVRAGAPCASQLLCRVCGRMICTSVVIAGPSSVSALWGR